ncbi:LIP-domain-containing protein [Teratosphaeria destructans]|uniref:LIP-domain-containing protein n=1 Tax=Teratosphaeria destructans TaxID=418781 RepID=A0A9W7SS84_9PEZI|nr:LIP-domain-containing protein [Teratosphaeria destructans]
MILSFLTLGAMLMLKSAAAVRNSAVLLPSNDPVSIIIHSPTADFYDQPENISSYKPGDVIRTREVGEELSGLIKGIPSISVKAFHQMLYRTTNTNGEPIAAMTSIFVPDKANPNTLLSYQCSYDTASVDYVPSYGFQAGANVTEIDDIIFITAALKKGWYVVTADYEGLNSQFTDGLISGYATLDAIRVALGTTSITGLNAKPILTAWGYSGGTIPTGWAAELQASYAPELDFSGIAIGGVIANLTASIIDIGNGGHFSGLAFSGITGLSRAYPDLAASVDRHLIPSKAAEFRKIGSASQSEASDMGKGKKVWDYFDIGEDMVHDPAFVFAASQSGIMGQHGSPKSPLYVYHAKGDEVCPVADVTDLVDKYCNAGATIQYEINTSGGHVEEALAGSAGAFEWLEDRMKGEAVSDQGECTTEDVKVSVLSWDVIRAFGSEVAAVFIDLF